MSTITLSDPVESCAKALIRESWQRCEGNPYISPGIGIGREYVGSSEVRQKIESLSEALGMSIDTMSRLRQISLEGGLAAFVSDQSGVVLKSYVDSPEAAQIAEQGLVDGSVWDERNVGTNSLGTSIVTKTPLIISGSEHYLGVLRSFTCAATPIQSPGGDVKGAITVSGFVSTQPRLISLTHSLVSEIVADLEDALFYRQFKDRYIARALTIGEEPYPGGCVMMALDNLGRILGLTSRGKANKAFADRACWIGRPLEEAVSLSFSDLMRRPDAPSMIDVPGMGTSQILLEGTSHIRRRTLLAPVSATRLAPTPCRESRPLELVAGSDPTMRELVTRGRRLCGLDLPLILLGETGTGKDTFAKALHAESDRRDKPFIAVNCAAVPASLLDTELFGYAPGTFTGGLKQGKVGKVIASHEGTLFLDEIGDMPMELQARLLHILESREVTPVGSNETHTVDIRVMAATNKDLPALIKAGQFREDLFYRLNGAQLRMPALRERTNLKELVDGLVADEAKGVSCLSFTEEAWNCFASYGWPGNVRQLKNTIKLLLCLSVNERVTLEDLPEAIRQSQTQVPTSPPQAISQSSATIHRSLDLHKNDAERQLILATLNECDGRVTVTAKKLGISRATLHRKLHKFSNLS